MSVIWCATHEHVSDIEILVNGDEYTVNVPAVPSLNEVCVGLTTLEDHLVMLESIGVRVHPDAYSRLHLKRQELENGLPE